MFKLFIILQKCFHIIFVSLWFQFCVLTLANANQNHESVAFLNGSTYLKWNKSHDFFKSSLGFSFKTCEKNGVLVQQIANENDSFKVELIEGQILISFYFSSLNQSYFFVDERKFDGNQWNTFIFNRSNINVYSNGKLSSIGNISNNLKLKFYKYFSTSDFYVGGEEGFGDGFVGCIRNGPYFSLNESSTMLENTCLLDEKGCSKEAMLCDSQPCLNGGYCVPSNLSYTCSCPTNYSGMNCEVASGPACNSTLDRCGNGTCVDVADGYNGVCQCDSGFYGDNCNEYGSNPCQSSPCFNNATCSSDDFGIFLCFCKTGFMGRFCELKASRCFPHLCQNNGVCVDVTDDYECLCNGTGYQGRNCQVEVNECVDAPCLSIATCYNIPGSYVCECPYGYQGQFCNVTVDYCSLEPCQNGGTCFSSDVDGQLICECAIGFAGVFCEKEIDYCIGNLCNSHSQRCVSEPGRHYCVCRRGFGGAFCEELNECESNPCRNGAACLDLIDAFQCQCLKGYEGTRCQVEINECQPDPCHNNAACSNLIGDYLCNCGLGWTGKNCSQVFDSCASHPCENNGSCDVLSHTESPPYVCHCLNGFIGERCETDVDDCVGITCDYNEACVDHVDTYSCDCVLGYERDDNNTCSVDINECVSNPCQNNATCSDLLGRFKCSCAFGYQGEVCEREKNFCDPSPCLNGGICQPVFGSYSCFCKSGTVGVHCEALFDHCLSDPCVHGECRSVDDQYKCDCQLGYDGINCENEINECLSLPCKNNATCNDLIGQFNCTCLAGWRGRTCEINIDDCLSQPCQNGGNCTDKVSSYSCSCVPGYAGVHCETEINECESSPCLHEGWCVDELASFYCVCTNTGYEGDLCDVEIDECELSPCQNGGFCVDQINKYTCQCLPGYAGLHCETDVNECASNPCLNNGTCLEISNQSLYPKFFIANFSHATAQGYVCDCPDGYEGTHCEFDIDECKLLNPCENNSTCTDLVNDYSCKCIGLHGGRNCSVKLTGCQKHRNCSNNAQCEPYLVDEFKDIHGYACHCARGFTGQFCDLSTSGNFKAPMSRAVFLANSSVTTNSVSFDFRTTISYAVLATLYFEDTALQVLLWNGILHYFHDSSLMAINNFTQNDAQWYSLQFHLHNKENNWTVAVTETEPNLTNLNISTGGLSRVELGCANSSLAPSFTGCMRDFSMNGQLTRFEKAQALEGVTEGCNRYEVCPLITCGDKGICIDLWHKASCQCGRPYIGGDCSVQRTAATFGYKDEHSYAEFELPFPPTTSFNISLFILTRKADCFLLQSAPSGKENNDSSQITLALSSGYLQVFVDEEIYLFTSLPVISDGKYHFIDVKIANGDLQTMVDHRSDFRTLFSKAINILSRKIIVGGPSKTLGVRQKRRAESLSYFKGALQDIQVGPTLLVFYRDQDEDDDIFLRRTRVYPVETLNIFRGELSDPVCGEFNSTWSVNPCQNNGSCTNLFNDYTCTCAEAWTGKNCHLPVFCKQFSCPKQLTCVDLTDGSFECIGPVIMNEFNQILIFLYNASNDLPLADTMHFKIRTRSLNATILHIGSEIGFIEFKLDHVGRVQVDFEMSNWTLSLTGNQPVADGQWHTITAEQKNRWFVIAVDDFSLVEGELPSISIVPEVLSAHSNVFIGSFDTDTVLKACIDQVRVGGQILPFYESSSIIKPTSILDSTNFELLPHHFEYGCYGDDVCNQLENSCLNDGICIDQFNQFSCECKAGFSGRNCQENINDCVNVSCSDRGECKDKINGFECECVSGYEGKLCELETDECLSLPCFNDGKCQNLIGSFACDCSGTNFTGEFCQINATLACGANTNEPCQNGGICSNVTSETHIAFNCSCFPPYFGKKCENEIDLCENITCYNGGSCVPDKTSLSSTCECVSGYGGLQCEKRIDICTNTTCMNNSTCIDTKFGYKCQCISGYIGENCEQANLCMKKSDQFCSGRGSCSFELFPEIIFSCSCLPNYAGERCEYLNPCYSIKCKNEGKCTIRWPSLSFVNKSRGSGPIPAEPPVFDCQCASGYSGKYCEVKNSSYINSTVVLACSIGGVVLFLLIIACLSSFLAVAVDRRASTGTYSPSKQEALSSRPAAGSEFVGMDVWTELKPPPRSERLI